MKRTLILSMLLTLCVADCCFADTITLRPAVRLSAAGGSVTLNDIAELEGEAAQAMANVIIAELGADLTREIAVRDVREKLTQNGAHWGRISLNGRTVVVRQARPGDSSPPLAMTALAIENDAKREATKPSREEFRADSLIGQRTVRGSIATLLVNMMRIPANDVRLSFDAADTPWLDQSMDIGQCELQPLSAVSSDRVEIKVRSWMGSSGSRAKQDRTVAVLPMIRVRSAQLVTDVEGGRVLSEADLRECEQWLPPSQAMQNIAPVAAIGRVASKSMKSGDLLRDKHVRRDVMIKRGELATVRCFVGGAVISMLAEARADATEGDTIDFRKQGERETFRATVSGRGEAVMNLNQR